MCKLFTTIKESRKLSIAAITILTIIGSTLIYSEIKNYMYEKSLSDLLNGVKTSGSISEYKSVDCDYSFKYDRVCDISGLKSNAKVPLYIDNISIYNPNALIQQNNLFQKDKTSDFNKPGTHSESKVIVSGIKINNKNPLEMQIAQYTQSLASIYGPNAVQPLSKVLNKELNGDIEITLEDISSTDNKGLLTSTEKIKISLNDINIFGELKYSVTSDFIANLGTGPKDPISALKGASLLSVSTGFYSKNEKIARDMILALYKIEKPMASKEEVEAKLSATALDFNNDIDRIFEGSNPDTIKKIKSITSSIIYGKKSEITFNLENANNNDLSVMIPSLSSSMNSGSINPSLKEFSLSVQ
jgi:hypothetical protein